MGKCDSKKYRWSKKQNKCVLKKSEEKKKGESGLKHVRNPDKPLTKRQKEWVGGRGWEGDKNIKTKEEYVRSGARKKNIKGTLVQRAIQGSLAAASVRLLTKK